LKVFVLYSASVFAGAQQAQRRSSEIIEKVIEVDYSEEIETEKARISEVNSYSAFLRM
jgi:hypothetical protein